MSDAPVQARDDLPHAVGPEPDYSESFYYQFGEPASGLSGFLRLSNRPNEGRGERTVCLFLPDGRAALSFERPTFADPNVLEAGGMRVEISDPLVAHRVSFAGEVVLLDDPWAMNNPKRAFGQSPRDRCSVELEVRATAPAQPFSLDDLGDFSPNHYEQFVAVSGAIELGADTIPIRAHGMRDHGWGRRVWAAPRFYRWLFGSCEGFGFAAGVLGRDAGVRTGGFVWVDDEMRIVDDVTLNVDYEGHAVTAVAIELTADDASWSIEGRSTNAVPLRHRRPDSDDVTRILETSVSYTANGHQMLGVAEFLDQMVNDTPVGIAEYDLAST